MSNLRRSSTVFDVVLRMREQVEAASLPPGVGGPVKVTSVDLSMSEEREVVAVVPSIDDTIARWERIGPAGRDEVYRLDIQIRTTTPGASETAAIARLRDVTAAVEAVWHDPNTKAFTPPDVPGVQLLGGVVGTTFAVTPAPEGWIGYSLIRFEISARI
jgi:hypothetical protein